MRYLEATFWKHRGDCCDFFEVLEVIEDNGENAEVKVAWHTQLSKSWRTIISSDQFRITKKEYQKYQPYSPRGENNS